MITKRSYRTYHVVSKTQMIKSTNSINVSLHACAPVFDQRSIHFSIDALDKSLPLTSGIPYLTHLVSVANIRCGHEREPNKVQSAP